MKTIGMIGSVSWQATLEYYRIINEDVAKALGGHHCAKIYMACMDFEELVVLSKDKNWDKMADVLTCQVKKLEENGADFFLICANTIHKVADKIAAKVNIPIIHIVDETAKEIKAKGIEKLSLLATVYTMEDSFYQDIMNRYGIEIMVPEKSDREFINKSIYAELVHGKILAETKKEYLKIIKSQIQQGAKGLILGCTEIPLLIKQGDVSIPIFDTTSIHAHAAAKAILG
jgi:aspartate racemase